MIYRYHNQANFLKSINVHLVLRFCTVSWPCFDMNFTISRISSISSICLFLIKPRVYCRISQSKDHLSVSVHFTSGTRWTDCTNLQSGPFLHTHSVQLYNGVPRLQARLLGWASLLHLANDHWRLTIHGKTERLRPAFVCTHLLCAKWGRGSIVLVRKKEGVAELGGFDY